ncbi:sulfatase family protein [Nonomuraea sp. CA-218870]|uniref:sulfatase family protein n=1 Tax=Nonomuraea sp. CA-218870 TaxID=3239998 RepID=UPI003D8B2755
MLIRCLACVLLLLSLAAEPSGAHRASRPSIVVILADDLEAGTLAHFPEITRHLVRQGTSFDRFFTADSWCCPSRSSILRSQYVHSHGVWTNTAPEGGFERFNGLGLERSTIGTWMRDAGYRTAYLGKYLNHYPGPMPETYVPPGWDTWHVPVRGLYDEYGYRLNSDGRPVEYGWGEHDHLADVLGDKAREFIEADGRPFFLFLAPVAPHLPAHPPVRHAEAFRDLMAPRTPSFDQADVSEEPAWLRARPPLSRTEIDRADEIHRTRMRAMLGVDDLVGTVMQALRDTGRLDDTYVFFTSDNGFHLGTHRLTQGKTTPFEEAIRVPLVVRGPGVPAGASVEELSATVDLAPTIAELGGAGVPPFAEGRSMTPLLRGVRPAAWRENVLVEFARPANQVSAAQTPVPGYSALRTRRHTYVLYETGEEQLYDLQADPYQLHNLARRADPELLANLRARLAAMRVCSGATCRIADTLTAR